MRVETVEFNGIVFRRYPDSRRRNHRVYFSAHISNRKPPLWLHREIWKAAHGPIPEGHFIHHRDGNPLNNSLENLECISRAGHTQEHQQRGDYSYPRNREVLDAIRPLAVEWHGSEEGQAWHREHGKRTWARRQPVARVCEQCGAAFEAM